MFQFLWCAFSAIGIILHSTSAMLYLPDIQQLVDFPQPCVDAYSPYLEACPGRSDIVGLGGNEACTADCLTQIWMVQNAVNESCSISQIWDQYTLIGKLRLPNGVQAPGLAATCLCKANTCPWHTESAYVQMTVQTASNSLPGMVTATATSSAGGSTVSSNGTQSNGNYDKEKLAKIMGGTLGGGFGLAAVIAAAYFVLKQRREKLVKKEGDAMESGEDGETGRRMLDGRPLWQELEQKQPMELPIDQGSTSVTPQGTSNEQYELDGGIASRFWPDGVSGGDGFVHEMAG